MWNQPHSKTLLYNSYNIAECSIYCTVTRCYGQHYMTSSIVRTCIISVMSHTVLENAPCENSQYLSKMIESAIILNSLDKKQQDVRLYKNIWPVVIKWRFIIQPGGHDCVNIYIRALSLGDMHIICGIKVYIICLFSFVL